MDQADYLNEKKKKKRKKKTDHEGQILLGRNNNYQLDITPQTS